MMRSRRRSCTRTEQGIPSSQLGRSANDKFVLYNRATVIQILTIFTKFAMQSLFIRYRSRSFSLYNKIYIILNHNTPSEYVGRAARIRLRRTMLNVNYQLNVISIKLFFYLNFRTVTTIFITDLNKRVAQSVCDEWVVTVSRDFNVRRSRTPLFLPRLQQTRLALRMFFFYTLSPPPTVARPCSISFFSTVNYSVRFTFHFDRREFFHPCTLVFFFF